MENQNNTQQIVITKSPKSVGISVILSFLFGSIGLFYSSVKAGIIMLIIEIIFLGGGLIISILTAGLGLIILIPIAAVLHIIDIVLGILSVKKYNKELLGNINN